MSDDLEYLRARIPDYKSYDDETARHDSDMRVRAFVGERLTGAQTRLASALDGATKPAIEALLMRCMFTDQVFIHNFEHANLEPPMIAALVRADRTVVDLAERLVEAPVEALPTLVADIDAQFDYRRAPEPVAT